MKNFLLIGDALRRNAYKYSVKVAAREGGKGEVEADARQEIELDPHSNPLPDREREG